MGNLLGGEKNKDSEPKKVNRESQRQQYSQRYPDYNTPVYKYEPPKSVYSSSQNNIKSNQSQMTGPVKNETKFAEVKVTSNLNYRFDSSSRPNLASSRLTSNIEQKDIVTAESKMQRKSSYSSTTNKQRSDYHKQQTGYDSDEQIQIRYTYKFRDLVKDLEKLPESGQKTYREEQLQNILNEELSKMKALGYDNPFRSYHAYKQKGRQIRKFLRRVRVVFTCRNHSCVQFKRKGKYHKWTSFYGLIFITYKFEKLRYSDEREFDVSLNKLKYPFVLNYSPKLYTQKCQSCSVMARGQIYQSQMITVSRMFCFMIAKILTLEPNPVFKPERHKHVDDYEKQVIPEEILHKKDSCQACIQGVCKINAYRKYKNHF